MTCPGWWKATLATLLPALTVLAASRRLDAAPPGKAPGDAKPGARARGSDTPDRARATIELRLPEPARFRAVLGAAMENATIAFDVEIVALETPETQEAPAPYRVTVEEGNAGIDVSVVDDKRDRIYARRVEAASSDDEVALEAAAHVVVYALEALGRGEIIGSPRARTPPRATVQEAPQIADRRSPARQSVSPPSLRFSFGTHASVTGYASNAPAILGVGAIAGVRLPSGPSAFEIAASLEQRVPAVLRTPSLASRFQLHAARIFVRRDLTVTPGVDLGAAFGVGFDRIGVTTVPRRGSSDPTIVSQDLVGIAAAAFGFRATLASHLRVQGDIGIELPWKDVEYIVQRRSENVTILAPWPLRPWMSVALVAEL